MMEENTLTKITEIIKALNGQGTAFERPLDAARKSLGVEGYLSDMLAEAIQRISVAQRSVYHTEDIFVTEMDVMMQRRNSILQYRHPAGAHPTISMVLSNVRARVLRSNESMVSFRLSLYLAD
jgi:hypothetical protein